MSSYCTYIILTSNKKYYVGHTNSLEDRFKRHLNGSGPKFTAQNKPIKVVWFQKFNTEMDAIRREKQLKGWTREKKEKLIDGVWK